MLTKQLIQHVFVAGLMFLTLGSAGTLSGQTDISINATGAVADPSAILDVSSTSSGLLTPRMTEAERDAIGNPADGLIIYQTDVGAGFWFYDGTNSQWRMLSRYLSGNIAMGDPPSTIVQGAGYTVTRIATGTDEIQLNESYSISPSVMVSTSRSDGSAPFLDDYCKPEFSTCGCHNIGRIRVYDGISVNAPSNLVIDNDASGCNTEPDRYKYYEAGDPVYVGSGVPDLCSGVSDAYSIQVRGNVGTAPCGTHRIYVWIDWQQDGFYDELQDQIVSTNAVNWVGGNVTQGNMSIPATAYTGDTYMRAMAIVNEPPNSCPSAIDGETEEYNIHLSCGPTAVYDDISSYCNIGDITPTSFRISCRRVGGEARDVQNYYFQVNDNDD